MSSDLWEAICRLEAWTKNYRADKSPEFITDLEVVIEAAKGQASHIITASDAGYIATLGMLPLCVEIGQNVCTCHEHDGSHACEFCRSQGYRGHMEAKVMQ